MVGARFFFKRGGVIKTTNLKVHDMLDYFVIKSPIWGGPEEVKILNKFGNLKVSPFKSRFYFKKWLFQLFNFLFDGFPISINARCAYNALFYEVHILCANNALGAS